MPRESFILAQDIASGQILDTHAQLGTNLQKLVDKKVIDTLMVTGVSTSGLTTRLDSYLLDLPLAVGPTDIGILTSKQHPLFLNGTANGVPDSFSEAVRGNLSTNASILDPVAMTVGLNTGAATVPANFAVGDLVRIQGQTLTGTFFAEIASIVGPVLTFVDPGTANPRFFIEAPSGTYFMERVRRWLMTWVDSVGGGFVLPADVYTIGILRRSYLANISVQLGWVVLPVEAESPKIPGGGGALTSGQVTSGFLGDAAVVSGSIASGQIGTVHISSGGLGSGAIGSGQIGSVHIASGTIIPSDISSGGITSGKIGDAAVTSGNISSGEIGWPHLASGTVRSGHIGDAAVVSGSVASGALGSVHLADGAVQSGDISSGQVGWAHLSSGAVRSGHIGDAAVSSGSIGSGQIGTVHISSGGLGSGAIGSGQIGTVHISSGGLGSGAIGSGQIASGHLASGLLSNLTSPNDIFRYSMMHNLL